MESQNCYFEDPGGWYHEADDGDETYRFSVEMMDMSILAYIYCYRFRSTHTWQDIRTHGERFSARTDDVKWV